MHDYKQLGFKAGLEIHQQLEGTKLFCNCPALVHDNKPEFTITRNLFASAGEGGTIDKAAAYEAAKHNTFHYQGRTTSTCLVEIDEEPPHLVNKEALETGLLVAKMLHATIVDAIVFMRKVVIDGSNVSGFQRTALIATDGFIETSKGKISIPTICLEEESAKKVRTDSHSITYRLDRLGIGLIEIATGPEHQDPEHVQESARILGQILRATGKVKRGIGTIRQDVNVSIAKGCRVEIKGFQDLRSIPKIIDYEVSRQQQKKEDPHVRKAEANMTTTYLRPMPGAARMYPETDLPVLQLDKHYLAGLVLPKDPREEATHLMKTHNLSRDHVAALQKNKGLTSVAIFESLMKNLTLKPAFVADVLMSYEKELLRLDKKAPTLKVTKETLAKTLEYVATGKISKGSLYEVLLTIATTGKADLSKYKQIDEKELLAFVTDLVKKNKNASVGALMGKIMAHYKGKVDGKKVNELLKNVLS